MIRSIAATLTIVLALPIAATAQTADLATAEQLSGMLKPMVMEKIPLILYHVSDNWGHQANIPVGLKWQGLRAEVQKSYRNHGEWKRLWVTSQDLPRTFDLRIHDLKNISSEKQTFKVFATMQVGALYEQQNWANGVKLMSGRARARVQVKVDLECENMIRFDFDKGLDVVLRMRVTGAKVGYDKFVLEHINGIGGSGAKLIGDVTHDAINRAKPSLERDLLARAGEAVVRAGDTREIRVGFSTLLKPAQK